MRGEGTEEPTAVGEQAAGGEKQGVAGLITAHRYHRPARAAAA
jgi:hypothetical protein